MARIPPATLKRFTCLARSLRSRSTTGKLSTKVGASCSQRCEIKHDRDINAAKNILRQGLNQENRTVGTTEIADCLGISRVSMVLAPMAIRLAHGSYNVIALISSFHLTSCKQNNFFDYLFLEVLPT